MDPEFDSVLKATEKATRQAERLFAKNPCHELVALFMGMGNEEVFEGLLDRFGNKNLERGSDSAQIWFWEHFADALKEAVEE